MCNKTRIGAKISYLMTFRDELQQVWSYSTNSKRGSFFTALLNPPAPSTCANLNNLLNCARGSNCTCEIRSVSLYVPNPMGKAVEGKFFFSSPPFQFSFVGNTYRPSSERPTKGNTRYPKNAAIMGDRFLRCRL